MNRNKILKSVVVASAIAGGISLSGNNVHATENNVNGIKTDGLVKNSVELSNVTKGKVFNINTNLRVRSDAGTIYDTIGYLYNGQEIQINADKGDWYRISFNGREGYVSKEYIKLNESTLNNGVTTGKKGQVINIKSNLNIRQSSSTSSAVIGTLKNGDTFEIISKSNGWYNIKSQNILGFINGDYVKEIGNSNETNTAVVPVETKTAIKGKIFNVTTNLRVRTSPSTSSVILGYMLNGQEVSITGENGDWYKISFNNTDGYVSKEFIKKDGATPVNTGSINVPQQTISGKGQVINITSSLNIRKSTSTSSAVIGTLKNGETIDILGKNGSWYNIKIGALTGYVSTDYLKEIGSLSNNETPSNEVIENQKGQVINITSNLRIRSEASTSSKVLGYLLNGQVVDVIGKNGLWIKINFNGQTGYISSEYIKFIDGNSTKENTNVTAIFNEVFNAMKSQLESPYVWGGAGEYLTTTILNGFKRAYPVQTAAGLYNRAESYVNQGYRAFDCSGLMQWGYRQAGISIGRSTWNQIENGNEVSLSTLKPGDLLFYSSLDHVGMYIGNGQWIEAPNSSADVRIVDVPWSKIARARRILG